MQNVLLMSCATAIVRSGSLFWLKAVVIVLFMLCCVVLVEWLLLKPCCVEMYGILFVIYGSSVFFSFLNDILYTLISYAMLCELSKRSDMFEVSHAYFVRPCGVVVLLPAGLVLWCVLMWLSVVCALSYLCVC